MARQTIRKPPQHMHRSRNVGRRRLIRRRGVASSPGATIPPGAAIYNRAPCLILARCLHLQRGSGRVFGIYMHNWDVNEEREGGSDVRVPQCQRLR